MGSDSCRQRYLMYRDGSWLLEDGSPHSYNIGVRCLASSSRAAVSSTDKIVISVQWISEKRAISTQGLVIFQHGLRRQGKLIPSLTPPIKFFF